jgi:hypothetical protein
VKDRLAHKGAGQEQWSATERAQRRRLVQVPEEMLGELRRELQEA